MSPPSQRSITASLTRAPRDKQRVGVEVPARGEPALPAVGAAQLLDGLLDERAVGAAALLAFGVAELGALGHGGCSSREIGGWARRARTAPGAGGQATASTSWSSWRRWARTAGQPACW